MSIYRDEYIAGLRQLADALEANPSLSVPWNGGVSPLRIFAQDRAEVVAWARVIPGRKTKGVYDSPSYGFTLAGSIRGLNVNVVADRRQVCRRVVTGTREVTEMVPAHDTPMIEVTTTVEDVEWICAPLLGDYPAVIA